MSATYWRAGESCLAPPCLGAVPWRLSFWAGLGRHDSAVARCFINVDDHHPLARPNGRHCFTPGQDGSSRAGLFLMFLAFFVVSARCRHFHDRSAAACKEVHPATTRLGSVRFITTPVARGQPAWRVLGGLGQPACRIVGWRGLVSWSVLSASVLVCHDPLLGAGVAALAVAQGAHEERDSRSFGLARDD